MSSASELNELAREHIATILDAYESHKLKGFDAKFTYDLRGKLGAGHNISSSQYQALLNIVDKWKLSEVRTAAPPRTAAPARRKRKRGSHDIRKFFERKGGPKRRA